MGKERLTAFSDGMFAIIMTIMVLDLHVPHGSSWHAITPLLPIFLSYVLSFVYVGLYWNNHHHLFHTVEHVTGSLLWANLFLLFCLSMFPFATGWMGENHFAALPTALYGLILFLAALAWFVLQGRIIRASGGNGALLQRAIGRDWKGKGSLLMYLLGVGLAFWLPYLAQGLYVLVAGLWLVPDRRIERALAKGA